MGGRIDIEADDVFEFLGELRVVRQLERADAMRRDLVGFQNTLHRTQAHPCGFRQHPAGPVGCFSGRRPERQVDHSLHGAGRQRWFAGLPRLVARQPFDALRHEPRLPFPNHGLGFARGAAHDLGCATAVGRGKRMMLARHTCFCGALRSETIASSRWRSARVTLTIIAAHARELELFRSIWEYLELNQTTSMNSELPARSFRWAFSRPAYISPRNDQPTSCRSLSA